MPMTQDRWQRLQDLFHRALALPPAERGTLLDHECAGDLGLRTEIERLLRASDRAGTFIETPAIVSSGVPLARDEASQTGRRIGAYRLVRPIGHGGMGAVYLAERDDGAFQQTVAIKLIKRGMDTDQVLARFRAERQILASLDHPNIARLLDGGTTDDGLPYFAMEFIEGHPIDAYAEAAGLGLEDRLRLFLHVCDAADYAHARGVIHRDIKPLNTLVTPTGVPKLLDFGIAKVLGDSPDDVTDTVTGLRLLTPDYASPEQVEGRRATVASDVYSLGVVLYELLTGRSPYRVTSRSPREIADAVRTSEPERPSTMISEPDDRVRVRHAVPSTGPHGSEARQLSRRLRGDLDTIVLTALRKEPERRYTSARALGEDIRRHLAGQPIEARGEELAYRVRKVALRRRGVLLTTVGVAAMIAAAWAGWLPSFGAPPEPTLISTNSLALRDRIVVADFTDLNGDTLLAAAITEAIRTDLSQSAVVRLMTPRQVLSALARMQATPDVALDDSLARELAVREGVKAIVSGSLSRVSGSYTINVQLLAAQTGEALAAVRETARDSTELIRAVDRASRTLRERIGESLRDIEQVPSLELATTASLPALRFYSDAQRLGRQGNRTAAIERFEQAIAIDSAFASAHLGVSMAYGSIGDEGRSFAAGERALFHQERLPFVERSMLLGSRAYARQDYPAAIRAYVALIERYPENVAALNNLALAHRDARRFALAETLFVRAMGIDSTIANFLFGLHSTQVLQGKFREAAATMDSVKRRFPDHPIYLTEMLQDAAAQKDWRRAVETAEAHIVQIGADTLQLVDPYEALAQIAMTRGQLREAKRLWEVHARVSRASGVMSRYLFGVLQRAHLALRYENDTTRAMALVDTALQATPLESFLPADRRYDEVARFYLAAGRRDRIPAFMAAAAANDQVLQREPQGERLWTRGMIALADGRIEAAVDTLRAASERHVCTICVLPDYARTLERAGRTEDAVEVYRRYVTTPWMWRYEPDAVELGWVLVRLSELAPTVGRADLGQDAQRELQELWKDADPPLRPDRGPLFRAPR